MKIKRPMTYAMGLFVLLNRLQPTLNWLLHAVTDGQRNFILTISTKRDLVVEREIPAHQPRRRYLSWKV